MSYCGLNNVKHKVLLDEMVAKGFIVRIEEPWGAKKIILVMVIAIIVAIPLSWHVSPFLLGTPNGYSFRLAGVVAIVTAAIFLAIGARQWMMLSDWTRKYKAYKEQQKKIDEKLDFEDSSA